MKKLIFILLSVVVLAGCQSTSVTGETVTMTDGSYQNISSKELKVMLKDKDFVFVNVHIPFAGNIPDTDLSSPFDQVTELEYLAQLPIDKNAKIVLYCRSGHMSQIASEELVSLGFTNVWNFKNGMVEWEQAGFELDEK
jgi:rhodanese-related sulfurtransferase